MKKRHLLFSVFTLFFWSTSFGQTSKDSMLVVKALTEINEGNITNANKLLQNVSSSGKKSENFLSCRGVYYEKSSSYTLAKKDFDSLYSQTGNEKYNKIIENLLQLEKRKLLQDSIKNNCKVCRRKGYYTLEDSCDFCNKGYLEGSSCTICFGTGKKDVM